MVSKSYGWLEGAILEDHTKKKHAILGEYFRQYLLTRCQLAQQERFRLVVIDGFAGGGLYSCGAYGSPIIFIDGLIRGAAEINARRAVQGLKPIEIECLLLLNDRQREVINLLEQNVTPHYAMAESTPNLRLQVEYFCGAFEDIYPQVKQRLSRANCSNVLFNLDQCGYSHVTAPIIRDIMSSWKKAEVILTFMIRSLLTYLSPEKDKSSVHLEPEVQARIDSILKDERLLSKKEWLGEVEKIVYEHLKSCATFVSPFSIKNPDGWQYWLMHFANFYRARQVYNNILHADNLAQTHFGRCGLNMLAYDPQAADAQLYLFDTDSRSLAIGALYEDIPRFIAQSGNMIPVDEFYAATYSETPAHSDDIHQSIIDNPDIEVITRNGGKRRQASAIRIDDVLKLKSQKSFFFGF